MEQLDSYWTDFYETFCLKFCFQKSVEKIQVLFAVAKRETRKRKETFFGEIHITDGTRLMQSENKHLQIPETSDLRYYKIWK
jgi:hypothetical protein